jgi:prephenate dehydratase
MGEALAALHRRCLKVRYLGSYPRSCPPEDGSYAEPAGGVGAEPVAAVEAERFAAAAAWLDAVRAGTQA